MRTLKVTIAYDGTDFSGFQMQKEDRTVEGEIFKALGFMHKHRVDFTAAGRTDAGVHAHGQVIGYESDLDTVPLERYVRALNAYLPLDIRARSVEEVDAGFHARYDARERSYRYYLWVSDVPDPRYARSSLRVVKKPDVRALNRLARVFEGEHDFTSFSASGDEQASKVRRIYQSVFYQEGPFLVYAITGKSFLWRMVRSIVGSLLAYESAGVDAEEIASIIKAQDRSRAGPSAPAYGLFLHEVRYEHEQRRF